MPEARVCAVCNVSYVLGQVEEADLSYQPSTSLRQGQRVVHPQRGPGVVVALEMLCSGKFEGMHNHRLCVSVQFNSEAGEGTDYFYIDRGKDQVSGVLEPSD